MPDKLDRLKRLSLAFETKRRALDMQAMVLGQRIAVLEDAERCVFRALQSDDSMHWDMASAYRKRAVDLKRQKDQLSDELRRLRIQSLESQRDVKRAEKLSDRERHAVENRTKARELTDAIEGFLIGRRN
jgi:hypothetical protein